MKDRDLLKLLITPETVKKSFIADKDANGKLTRNVANYGLLKHESATRTREGEYTGFRIEALEDIKPLLTDYRVTKAVKFLVSNNIQEAAAVLYLTEELSKYGISIIYFVLHTWLTKNEIQTPPEYINNISKLDKTKIDPKLIRWITTVRYDPINGLVRVIGVGQSKKGNSVVPESWLNREFTSCENLHKEMDKLEWRQSKPPVTTAVSTVWRLMTTPHG
jgi:hypothetical protein